MHVFGLNLPKRIPCAPELSRKGKWRLELLEWHQAHSHNGRLTCRHFGISPDTFYRWKRRYNPHNLHTLEDESHRPHKTRQPTWPRELALEVLHLREQYPRWGKDKLAPLLRQRGWQVSVSMVGRILTSLKTRGQLREPQFVPVTAARKHLRRPYAVRKPKEYPVQEPCDLVQVDTLDVRPLPGVVLKQFTARDVVSRWDVLAVRTRATATTATDFLATLQKRLPFPLRAIQVDGGSEFMAGFETACQQGGIRLFVLPPHSPKLNGCVERANRTHAEEFWECYDGDLDISTVQAALQRWEHVYNHIRPHQALGYLTPAQFLAKGHTHMAAAKALTLTSRYTDEVKRLIP